MQNHVIKKIFQNQKILHFLGVKSEIYQYGILYDSVMVISVIQRHVDTVEILEIE